MTWSNKEKNFAYKYLEKSWSIKAKILLQTAFNPLCRSSTQLMFILLFAWLPHVKENQGMIVIQGIL